MIYWNGDNGKYVTEKELNAAIRLTRMFESGILERIEDEQFAIAAKIAQGKQTNAVSLVMDMYGMNRNEARKYLEANGEEMLKKYFNSKSQESLCAGA